MVKTETNSIHLTAFIYQPVAAPHQAFLSISSEVPLVKKSSFPRGKPRTQKLFDNAIQRSTQLRKLRVAKLAPPTGVRAFIWVLAKIRGYGRMLSAPTVAAAEPPTGRHTRRLGCHVQNVSPRGCLPIGNRHGAFYNPRSSSAQTKGYTKHHRLPSFSGSGR